MNPQSPLRLLAASLASILVVCTAVGSSETVARDDSESTDIDTCPLPPRQNRLAARIVAGEKRFDRSHH